MPLMLGNTYKALIKAGAREELAEKAALELAEFELRQPSMQSNLSILKWMVGVNLAINVVILIKLLG